MKIVVFWKNTRINFVEKHKVVQEFREMGEVKQESTKNILAFLRKTRNDPNLWIIFYGFTEEVRSPPKDVFEILDTIDVLKLKSKIIFMTIDFWFHPAYKRYNSLLIRIFGHTNIFCVTFANSIEQLNEFHNSQYKNSSIICQNIWSSYEAAFIPFNPSPKHQICVSGASGAIETAYPER